MCKLVSLINATLMENSFLKLLSMLNSSLSLMMLEIVSQNARPEWRCPQLDPKEIMVKGRNVGHRCGACHRASDAQIRIARIILEYNVTCRLEFFSYLRRCEMSVCILASCS